MAVQPFSGSRKRALIKTATPYESGNTVLHRAGCNPRAPTDLNLEPDNDSTRYTNRTSAITAKVNSLFPQPHLPLDT
jgi:hypothetical protein